MKCAALKNIKEFEIKEIAKPESRNGEVVIEVSKCGICGSDLHYFEIGQPEGLVLGHEYCGRVIDKGSRDDLEVGSRVTALPISPCNNCEACKSGNVQYCKETWTYATGLSLTNPGALAKYMSIRADMVIKVPDNISDEEVAMVEPTAVGLHAVHLANIEVGDNVLVIGGGIIGQVSAMFAKMAGAINVTLFETNEKRAKKALKLGVIDNYVNVLDEKAMKDNYEKIGLGYDKVIECCGNEKAVSSAINYVKPGATVVLVGVSLKPITIPSAIIVTHELVIKGAIAYTKDEFETCISLIASKKIDVLKFLDRVVSLEEVNDAYNALLSSESEDIKILVDLTKEEK